MKLSTYIEKLQFILKKHGDGEIGDHIWFDDKDEICLQLFQTKDRKPKIKKP